MSCIFAARTLDFAIKFRLVFRYEAMVFSRYVSALLSVGLLRKFEAYLVYLSLILTKNPRRFSFFSKIPPFHLYVAMVFPRELMTCAVVFQLCLAGPDFLSMHRVLVSYYQPIRFARFDGKSLNCGLPVLDKARALDSCHRPEGSWALGTRMVAIRTAA